MIYERYHSYKCTACGRQQDHACDRPAEPAPYSYIYSIAESNKEPHSVEVARNTKGEYSFVVKAYGATIDEALKRCQQGVLGIRFEFPEFLKEEKK